MTRIRRRQLQRAFDRLAAAFGPQDWWPADSAFEVMVGAILTQNTAWTNVERAMQRLKARDRLDPQALAQARHRDLARWIRPCGYFNVKARRLKAYCRWYLHAGGYPALAAQDTPDLREQLLTVPGVGAETADDILLYAFHRPVFVVDAYTRRIFGRLGWIDGDEAYDVLRFAVERALGPDTAAFNELHALIVVLGKDICRPRPRCDRCPLERQCPTASAAAVS